MANQQSGMPHDKDDKNRPQKHGSEQGPRRSDQDQDKQNKLLQAPSAAGGILTCASVQQRCERLG